MYRVANFTNASRNATAAKWYGKQGHHFLALDDNNDEFDSDSILKAPLAKTSSKPSLHTAKKPRMAAAMQGKAETKNAPATMTVKSTATEKVKTVGV